MRYYELLFEAAYDSMITSMLSKYPDFIDAINWAKQTNSLAKRQDRVVWYLRQLRGIIEAEAVKNKNTVIEKLQETLDHYLLQEIPKINSYIFSNDKNIDVTFNELKALEKEFHKSQRQGSPVPIKKGDYKLIEYPDGSNWWFIDRAYCKDEGRSGRHCGNVAGQTDKAQRILSYRDRYGGVLLTFILHRDGRLGEMKARYNRKPDPKYHKVIVDLLSNNIVKGIKSGGYLPQNNFSINDLESEDIKTIYEVKPKLVLDELKKHPEIIFRLSKDVLDDEIINDTLLSNKTSASILALAKNPSVVNWIYFILDNKGKPYITDLWYKAPLAAQKATTEILVDEIEKSFVNMDTPIPEHIWPKKFRTPYIAKKALDSYFDESGNDMLNDSVVEALSIALPNVNTDKSQQEEFLSYMSRCRGGYENVNSELEQFFDKNPNLKHPDIVKKFRIVTSSFFSSTKVKNLTGSYVDDKKISVKDFLEVFKLIDKDKHDSDAFYNIISSLPSSNLAKAVSLLDDKMFNIFIQKGRPDQVDVDDYASSVSNLLRYADTEETVKNILLKLYSSKLKPWVDISDIFDNLKQSHIHKLAKWFFDLDIRTYEWIPSQQQTKEMTLKYIYNIPKSRFYIESIPDKFMKDKDVIDALKKNGYGNQLDDNYDDDY